MHAPACGTHVRPFVPILEEIRLVYDLHAYAMHALLYVCIQVRKFLRHGGHVDTVYKSAYGWDVGADYAHTRPSDGATPLNYVATWTDVIGLTDAAALVGAAPSSTGLRVGAQPLP